MATPLAFPAAAVFAVLLAAVGCTSDQTRNELVGVPSPTPTALATERPAFASASPKASAGTFKSNEDAAHEANESAAVEAQENAGQRPGGGSGKFTPNEDPTHEQGESAAREAQENAGQHPTVP